MTKKLFLLFFFLAINLMGQEAKRIQNIRNQLELFAMDNSELHENLKLEINISNVTLPNYLMAVSKVHNLNITVSPDLQNIAIINNFSDVSVADLLVFLCKQYSLDIDFTGNIINVAKYVPAPIEIPEKEPEITFDSNKRELTLDLKSDPMEKVFRKIMDLSGENLLYANGTGKHPITLYLKNVPFDKAMEKLADMNTLTYSKSKDNFHLFNPYNISPNAPNNRLGYGSNSHYEVLDTINKFLNVDLKNHSIATIVHDLSQDLRLDYYTATPLDEAGEISFKAKGIYFDDLLRYIFEGQENDISNTTNFTSNKQNPRENNSKGSNPIGSNKKFTFKKEKNIYFFGTTDQLSVRNVEVVQMMHRSVELLSDPSSVNRGYRSAGRTQMSNINYLGGDNQNNYQNGQQGFNSNRRTLNTQSHDFGSYNDATEALISILPDDIKADLDIKIDFELNSFLISGPSSKIVRFKKFIEEIDKPVPVVLIEVMIIEVKKSSTVETGISWGIGDGPTKTQGNLFPETDFTMNGNTINKVIGGFDGFGSFNMGKVVPDFFATIKALETNGNLKIRSTPKLSTLNGHRANLSIGETTYYVITNQNYFGSQNPIPSETRNYAPIDAELAVSIKPLVSGNGQVTLDINVIQSDFSGERIEEDAPPGLTSREFSSIIRMQNQDLAILGGLEEKIKNDSGNGVPLLARIPVIKWLFSKRKREDTKQKLTILIKPTVIY
ncbi:general secretion pathway protein GspD [Arenibacter sp. M-2]|uniref:type II secretion system protein GspD n=1 Tax=Arenibacter sp. M-2 TaxID=3053612 RepID=UPI0025706FB5|nr:general secretion pathway protein GspD [Arenibacter sp. M-2]MDL5514714.1 general secretion pathway protein GspD [Arenibacter sp. M-2]